MSLTESLRQFRPRGVFWRRYLAWAVRSVPWYIEMMTVTAWTALFWLLWAPGRRAVATNLASILPRSWPIANLFRVFRVFLAFAWNFTDAARYNELHTMVDWEFEGIEHLRALAKSDDGAIILTAHMGNYDLGSYLFAENIGRKITVVRVPEVDPESEEYSRTRREYVSESLKVRYNQAADRLALELVDTLRSGEVVAIQGDRVLEGLASTPSTLFGRSCRLPTGPFVLAMTTRVPIYPLFVSRVGMRRYRIMTHPPIHVERTSRDRDHDIAGAVETWRAILENVIREHWQQWFTFEPFFEEEVES